MAFTSTIVGRENLGSVTLMYGTYTSNAGDNGGTITTGFGSVFAFGYTPTGAVDESNAKYSQSGGVVTLVTSDASKGSWYAIGK